MAEARPDYDFFRRHLESARLVRRPGWAAYVAVLSILLIAAFVKSTWLVLVGTVAVSVVSWPKSAYEVRYGTTKEKTRGTEEVQSRHEPRAPRQSGESP